jgi:diguanylate cyclase (GGDEF)-like protein
MKPTTSHRTGALTAAIRKYWWVASIGGLYFTGGFVAWGGTTGAVASSGLFLATAVIGLGIHYRAPHAERRTQIALILVHMLIGQAVLTWQQTYLPLSDYSLSSNPADKEFLVYLVSALMVVTMSMYGGIWGAMLGLGTHYGLIFDLTQPFSFKWAFPCLLALVGNIVSTALWRLDQATEQLEELANRDSLTGLYNRLRLTTDYDRIRSLALETRKGLLLMAWDLDDLKEVNDSQGHAAGDGYIREFATALRQHVRQSADERTEDAAFRVGGDEFISLHVDAPDGATLLSRVHQVFPSVSAGWVRCNALNLDQALTQADKALYANKLQRKGEIRSIPAERRSVGS